MNLEQKDWPKSVIELKIESVRIKGGLLILFLASKNNAFEVKNPPEGLVHIAIESLSYFGTNMNTSVKSIIKMKYRDNFLQRVLKTILTRLFNFLNFTFAVDIGDHASGTSKFEISGAQICVADINGKPVNVGPSIVLGKATIGFNH